MTFLAFSAFSAFSALSALSTSSLLTPVAPAALPFALTFAATFILTFALGSVPWGIIISKLFYKKDLRTLGSGNIGTTNALRSLGKRGGGLVFVLDFGKGLLSGLVALVACGFLFWDESVFLQVMQVVQAAGLPGGAAEALPAQILQPAQSLLACALAGCALGHIFSPWLGFRGGKGIAVAVGCLFLTFGWLPTLLELSIFIVLVLVTRYVSIGSIVAAATCPFFALWLFADNYLAVALCTLVGLVIIWAHRGNIKRLREGSEVRVGKGAKT
jgi:glycerol-3-phosphate acyltransferase PlsY